MTKPFETRDMNRVFRDHSNDGSHDPTLYLKTISTILFSKFLQYSRKIVGFIQDLKIWLQNFALGKS